MQEQLQQQHQQKQHVLDERALLEPLGDPGMMPSLGLNAVFALSLPRLLSSFEMFSFGDVDWRYPDVMVVICSMAGIEISRPPPSSSATDPEKNGKKAQEEECEEYEEYGTVGVEPTALADVRDSSCLVRIVIVNPKESKKSTTQGIMVANRHIGRMK